MARLNLIEDHCARGHSDFNNVSTLGKMQKSGGDKMDGGRAQMQDLIVEKTKLARSLQS